METKYDKLIFKLKDSRIGAYLMIIGFVLVGVFTFIKLIADSSRSISLNVESNEKYKVVVLNVESEYDLNLLKFSTFPKCKILYTSDLIYLTLNSKPDSLYITTFTPLGNNINTNISTKTSKDTIYKKVILSEIDYLAPVKSESEKEKVLPLEPVKKSEKSKSESNIRISTVNGQVINGSNAPITINNSYANDTIN